MKKCLVALLAVALVLVGALLTLVMPWRCPVTRAASGRVKEGMSLAEVHAVLGGPPGDYRTRPAAPQSDSGRFFSGPLRLIERWEGDEGTVEVQYYPAAPGHERVMLVSFKKADPYSPSLLELALWRLERLLGRAAP